MLYYFRRVCLYVLNFCSPNTDPIITHLHPRVTENLFIVYINVSKLGHYLTCTDI